ncbi:MAG: ATP-binding protein [Prevotellaceae bacterium]|jgi:hypothetical protein|nr:ATP-binding protein [Prevotellaceae bacterium]
MTATRRLPIGIQDFEKLRREGHVYVDKTAYIYELSQGGNPYFLGRPRRFGKSLLLSTMHAYFEGKRELFDGLAIAGLETEWTSYPVFHLDMNTYKYTSMEAFMLAIDKNLTPLEEKWGREADDKQQTSGRLLGLIERAYQQTQKPVVVLIDEYDKPLLDTLHDRKLHEAIRNELQGFYGVLKSADKYLRFLFLTGITKFSQVSIFSTLNQLGDISLDDAFSAICGITETELLQNFEPELQALALAQGTTFEKTLAELKKHYDGYHFSRRSEDIYNPFSVLNTLYKKEYADYWFATGTPSFLIRLIDTTHFRVPQLDNDVFATASEMFDYRIGSRNILPLLYQSGYLTVKEYIDPIRTFRLGFPNEEVKVGFLQHLLPEYIPAINDESDLSITLFVRDLYLGNVERFMQRLRVLFAKIPYKRGVPKRGEDFYQSILYTLFNAMGLRVQMEMETSQGRADIVAETQDAVYVFEFKMIDRGTAEEALAQIDDKGYLIPYTIDSRRLVKIGVEFDAKDRTIGRWLEKQCMR